MNPVSVKEPGEYHIHSAKSSSVLDFSKSGWSHRPQPPQNCTIAHQTVSSLRVGCYTPHEAFHPDHPDDVPTSYMLQVFDAKTRHLVASATSQTAAMLEITDLPPDRKDLVLSVRTVTAHATSDAVSIYTIFPERQDHHRGGKTGFELSVSCVDRRMWN